MVDSELAGFEDARRNDSEWTSARSLDTPEAREYSEWLLLVADLKYALRRGQLWSKAVESTGQNEYDLEVSESLFRDAVISLVACFDETSPVYLDAGEVYRSLAGGHDYLQWLQKVRHTWIAHRSGPYRQCAVAIVVDESTGELRGHGHLMQLWKGPKPEAGDDLVRVMKTALLHARRELTRCESVVKRHLAEMTNGERLRLPIATTTAPSPTEIHMGRRKFKNIKNSGRQRSRS